MKSKTAYEAYDLPEGVSWLFENAKKIHTEGETLPVLISIIGNPDAGKSHLWNMFHKKIQECFPPFSPHSPPKDFIPSASMTTNIESELYWKDTRFMLFFVLQDVFCGHEESVTFTTDLYSKKYMIKEPNLKSYIYNPDHGDIISDIIRHKVDLVICNKQSKYKQKRSGKY